jgi:iron(III) transport system permease protein
MRRFQSGETSRLDAYRFIFDDPDFWNALFNSVVIAAGMVLIALPLGAALRSCSPAPICPASASSSDGARSCVHLADGACVRLRGGDGPGGLLSLWAKAIVGDVPWNVYSLTSIAVIAGLTRAARVLVFVGGAEGLGSDVEEAARVVGANPLRVALNVSLR